MFFCQYCEILRKPILRKIYERVPLNCIVGNKVEGRISRRFLKENKTRQIFWGIKTAVLCFLETPVLRFAFSLITDFIKKVELNPTHSL